MTVDSESLAQMEEADRRGSMEMDSGPQGGQSAGAGAQTSEQAGDTGAGKP